MKWFCQIVTYASINDALNVLDTLVGCASFNLNTLSITEISVEVELIPTNALQSFTTQPAPRTSLPRFTVPAYLNHKFTQHYSWFLMLLVKSKFFNIWMNFKMEKYFSWLTTRGTCNRDDNSSWSSIDVFGCTIPPWLLSTVYDPTKTLFATVWRNTSTFNTSPIISSVSYDFDMDYIKD